MAGAWSQKPMQAVGSTVNMPSAEISPAHTPSFWQRYSKTEFSWNIQHTTPSQTWMTNLPTGRR